MFTWILRESYKFGLSPTLPAWAHDLWFVIVGLLIFVVIVLPLIIAIAYLTLWERKVLAWSHYRLGPNRAGWMGLLQPLLDAVKLLIKEDIVPICVDWPIWFLAPIVAFTPMVASFLAIPMSNAFVNIKIALPGEAEPVLHVFQIPMIAGDLNIGLLFILALSSLVVVGIFMAGWGSNNKYSLFGGMRSAGQIISYEIPVILSLLCVVLLAGSLSTIDIVKSQKFIPSSEMKTFLEIDRISISGANFDYTKRDDYLKLKYFDKLEGDEKLIAAGRLYHKYNDYVNTKSSPRLPFIIPLLIAFIIYFIAGVAETNRSPFDLPEGESEIVAGFHTEYSGIKFGLFFLGEYGNMILISAIATTCFLGGYLGPAIPGMSWIVASTGEYIYYLFWFILKVFILVSVMVWFRATFPRLRVDQLTDLAWKVLLPISFANLLIVGYIHFADWNFTTFAETNWILWYDNIVKPFKYPALRTLMVLFFTPIVSDVLYRYKKIIMPRLIYAEITFILAFLGYDVFTLLFGSKLLEVILRCLFYAATVLLAVWMLRDVIDAGRRGEKFLDLIEEEQTGTFEKSRIGPLGRQETMEIPTVGLARD